MRPEEIEQIRLFKEAVKRGSTEYIRLVRTTYVEDIEKLLEELDALRNVGRANGFPRNPAPHHGVRDQSVRHLPKQPI